MKIMFDLFHRFSSLSHNFASLFMTLIPKVKNPYSFEDFRPISLVGSLYKLLSKGLANKIDLVMVKLISPNHSAYLKGIFLVNNVVVVNEVVDFFKQFKKVPSSLKLTLGKFSILLAGYF